MNYKYHAPSVIISTTQSCHCAGRRLSHHQALALPSFMATHEPASITKFIKPPRVLQLSVMYMWLDQMIYTLAQQCKPLCAWARWLLSSGGIQFYATRSEQGLLQKTVNQGNKMALERGWSGQLRKDYCTLGGLEWRKGRRALVSIKCSCWDSKEKVIWLEE